MQAAGVKPGASCPCTAIMRKLVIGLGQDSLDTPIALGLVMQA